MTKRNSSLVKKTSARLLAVQGLYQYGYCEGKFSPDQMVHRMLVQLEDEMEKPEDEREFFVPEKPHQTLFRGVLTGAITEREAINDRLCEVLGERFEGERLSKLLKAILRAAAFEFIYTPDLRSAIILDEYVTITASFFDDPELGLLNGLLQEMATKLRAVATDVEDDAKVDAAIEAASTETSADADKTTVTVVETPVVEAPVAEAPVVETEVKAANNSA